LLPVKKHSPASEASRMGQSESETVFQPDWSSNEASLIRWDTDFAQYQSGILSYSAEPDFISYQPAIVSLLSASNRLHEFSRLRTQLAARHRDLARWTYYSSAEIFGIATLNGVLDNMKLKIPELVIEEAQGQISDAEGSGAGQTLAEYSNEAESVRRFGEDPALLFSIARYATTRIGIAREQLSSGDAWGGLFNASIGNLDSRYISARLCEYYLDVSLPRSIAKARQATQGAK
ncbi:MAG TPA: hypothetical protein VG322_07120, partial [Candidatus Acidoferrales bacterium]|nr:hypothetical protein [Candidatus Acidoferrales bacterium]